MTTLVLKLSDPKVSAVLSDIPVMQHWEMLRRSPSPLSTPELASVCRISLDVAQASLDRLVESGFAVKLRASTAKRCTTYRPISTDVVVEWSRASSADREWMREHRRRLIEISRKRVDDALASKAVQSLALRWLDARIATTLNIEESKEVQSVLVTAVRSIAAIEERAESRRRAEAPAPTGSPTRGYQISIVMQPLEQPALPFDQTQIWESEAVARVVAKSASAPQAVLTDNEYAIARRLAAGESRPKIASALGLSKHTIATVGKRIYAKLGVHSRAELVRRMAGT